MSFHKEILLYMLLIINLLVKNVKCKSIVITDEIDYKFSFP